METICFADQTVLQRLVPASILSRIDYCNAVMKGPPLSTITPIERVTNSAIRLVADVWPRDRVPAGMKAPHWLPV